MENYFIDYPHLLNVNLDYSKEISLEIVEDKDTIVPIMKYLGTDKKSGDNIISNLKKIISIKPENNGYNLYLKDECFAHFKEDEATKKIVLDTEHPQKHLTAFEMRLLARKNIEPQVFSRDGINGLKHSTDLHTHFAGCLSPEDLIEIGIKHDLSIPSGILSKSDIDVSQYNDEYKVSNP